MGKDVIIACDFASKAETLDFLEVFEGRRPFIKIGMELFYTEGPEIVNCLKMRGHKVFLDLKLHDIPNTVRKSMKVLAGLDIDMCNVHASGNFEMMQAAVDGLNAGTDGRKRKRRPLLIAVTQLTSTSEDVMRRDLLISRPLEDVVSHYASNARRAGLDGVVCSPLEAQMIHDVCGEDFLTVTPGVRFAGDAMDDQSRVTTPARARELGSDYIVVGRSITNAGDPLAAYERCIRDFIYIADEGSNV